MKNNPQLAIFNLPMLSRKQVLHTIACQGKSGGNRSQGTIRLVVGQYGILCRNRFRCDGRGPGAFVAEVDFGLAATMCDVDVQGKEDFAAGMTTVRGVVDGAPQGHEGHEGRSVARARGGMVASAKYGQREGSAAKTSP